METKKFFKIALLSTIIHTGKLWAEPAKHLKLQSKSQNEIKCFEVWKKKCSHLSEDKTQFLECTKKKLDSQCKKIIAQTFRKSGFTPISKVEKERKNQVQYCVKKLLVFCPLSKNVNAETEKMLMAKCFKSNIQKVDFMCQHTLKSYMTSKMKTKRSLPSP